MGVGTDVHAFGGDGGLWLAGLSWPGEPALHGHSDGDAVAHAIVDAVLAAAGLGDIGTHFGTDHPEYAAWLAERYGTVAPAALVPGYEALTSVQRALADLVVLSRCETVAAAGWSAFSRVAVNAGGGTLVRPDELVPAED